MVQGVCNWRDMELLIRLEMTMTGDRHVKILSDHLRSFMSIVHSFRWIWTMRHPNVELLPGVSRNTLMTLHISIGHLNCQI